MPDKPSWVLYRLPKKAKYNDVMQVHYLRKCRPPLIPLVTTINWLPLRRTIIAPSVVSMSRKQKMASEPQAAFDDYVWGTETWWFFFSLRIRLIFVGVNESDIWGFAGLHEMTPPNTLTITKLNSSSTNHESVRLLSLQVSFLPTYHCINKKQDAIHTLPFQP